MSVSSPCVEFMAHASTQRAATRAHAMRDGQAGHVNAMWTNAVETHIYVVYTKHAKILREVITVRVSQGGPGRIATMMLMSVLTSHVKTMVLATIILEVINVLAHHPGRGITAIRTSMSAIATETFVVLIVHVKTPQAATRVDVQVVGLAATVTGTSMNVRHTIPVRIMARVTTL